MSENQTGEFVSGNESASNVKLKIFGRSGKFSLSNSNESILIEQDKIVEQTSSGAVVGGGQWNLAGSGDFEDLGKASDGSGVYKVLYSAHDDRFGYFKLGICLGGPLDSKTSDPVTGEEVAIPAHTLKFSISIDGWEYKNPSNVLSYGVSITAGVKEETSGGSPGSVGSEPDEGVNSSLPVVSSSSGLGDTNERTFGTKLFDLYSDSLQTKAGRLVFPTTYKSVTPHNQNGVEVDLVTTYMLMLAKGSSGPDKYFAQLTFVRIPVPQGSLGGVEDGMTFPGNLEDIFSNLEPEEAVNGAKIEYDPDITLQSTLNELVEITGGEPVSGSEPGGTEQLQNVGESNNSKNDTDTMWIIIGIVVGFVFVSGAIYLLVKLYKNKKQKQKQEGEQN